MSTCAPTDKSLIGELDAAREAVAAAKKALVDLESEARGQGAAGGPSTKITPVVSCALAVRRPPSASIQVTV